MTYRNKYEAKCAARMDPAFQYEAVRLRYTIAHDYLPDWIDVAGKRIVEAKGLFDAEDRRKLKAVRQQHPDYTIEVWFQNPHRTISKSSKTTYAQWCEKNDILWTIGPK